MDTLSHDNSPVVFTINKKQYTVDDNVPHGTTLNIFLREYMNLRGTKAMCHEGGCGVCIVSVTAKDLTTGKDFVFSVNSCLMMVHSCHGWAITTIEGLGRKETGYNILQSRLATMHGSQCGYCSPGMVMNMYSLTAGKRVSMEEVENSFGGNICRCTGYRPILDAFKTFAVDATPEILLKCQDIEDLNCVKQCPWKSKQQESVQQDNLPPHKWNTTPSPGSATSYKSAVLTISQPQSIWYSPTKIEEIYKIFTTINKNDPYMIVAGNTAQGVYRRTVEPKVYIDINRVEELRCFFTDPVLKLGANMSLNDTLETLQYVAKQRSSYRYGATLAAHIDLIANVPVRNTGTIAGNLSIKQQHREFPSDMFLMMETVGAKLLIGSSVHSVIPVELPAFLNMDMRCKLIHALTLPPLDSTHVLRTYKITPRAQNAHAYVNAGFLFKLSKTGEILGKPRIVFGGINPKFVHALGTESYLQGKNLFDIKALQTAFQKLDAELQPDHVLPDASPAYRKGLAIALFYKYVLSIAPKARKEFYASGGQLLKRPISSGHHQFQTDPKEWPLNKPVVKLEALAQCSGEAEYVNDFPSIHGEVFAAFVLTKVSRGTLVKIDPSAALATPGVLAFIGADKIPGRNNFTKFTPPLFNMDHVEEIFCSGKILYAGQPVGVVVAETWNLALEASNLVELKYSGVTKPILTIEDAIKSGDASRIVTETTHIATDTKARSQTKHVIKGKFKVGSQYHFTMETQTCICIPTEDGIDVYATTQWMDMVQRSISDCLAIPEHAINVKVRRLGGGYGAKISRNTQVATACALAAVQLDKPVRFVMALEPNMESMGKRYDCYIEYEVGCDDKGKIRYMTSDLYQNSGCTRNESVLTFFTQPSFINCYEDSTWTFTGKAALTDVHSNTYCRAPGSLEGMAFIENIMEHLGAALGKDPLEVRLENIKASDDNIPKMIRDLQKTAEYDKRKQNVEEFNKENRWKKRGISLVPMNFGIIYLGGFHSLVSIYAGDGTVSVSHGGIEMGQGINTKVAQACAKFLGIPLEMVAVKPSNNLTSPNSIVSGASITSETCVYATMIACQELTARLEPIKKEMPGASWKQLVATAFQRNIDLCATYMFTSREVQPYSVYGVTIAEVELDVLTGQLLILRVDILEDAGKSLSPEVDVGQVEGAFVMGIGLWLTEELIRDPQTGQLLTNRTWNYKPPGAKDIPIDFRIELRRDAPNPFGVLRSKATGEPATCMSCAVFFAIKHALSSARKDAGNTDPWFQFDGPATAENIFLTSLTNYKQFQL